MRPQRSPWFYVIAAGALEIVWASGLKYEAVPVVAVVVSLILTYDFLIRSAKMLPVGTMYAVFAGIGTVGTVIVESIVSGTVGIGKLALILALLACVVGLKVTSDEEANEWNG